MFFFLKKVLDLIIKNRLKTIGLNFYGKLIRNGYISFIGIQAENCTYILDFMSIMQQEGVEAQVIESLGYILTNGNIVKVGFGYLFLNENFILFLLLIEVISNCAFISDILYHKYQIVLQNVFDLQVFFFAFRQIFYKFRLNKYFINEYRLHMRLFIKI